MPSSKPDIRLKQIEKVSDHSSLAEQWINSNTNTDRGNYYQKLLIQGAFTEKASSQHNKESILQQQDSSRHTKMKKKVSRKALFSKGIQEGNKFENEEDSFCKYEKPNLEIQVDSIIDNAMSYKKNSLKLSSIDPPSVEVPGLESQKKQFDFNANKLSKKTISDQKGHWANDSSISDKFQDFEDWTDNEDSQNQMEDKFSKSNLNLSSEKNPISSLKNSTQKVVNKPMDYSLVTHSDKPKKFGLSKEAQILMDKLNIPLIESHENLVQYKLKEIRDEEEKGDFVEEEFDQSRPMTTRIYNNDEDQYKNILSPNLRHVSTNKHASVEAGLARDDNSPVSEEKRYRSEFVSIDDDNMPNSNDNSMIIRNGDDFDDGPNFAFTSPDQTPTHGYRYDETGEDDMMTVIENDWDNEYSDIFKSLKDYEKKLIKQQK